MTHMISAFFCRDGGTRFRLLDASDASHRPVGWLLWLQLARFMGIPSGILIVHGDFSCEYHGAWTKSGELYGRDCFRMDVSTGCKLADQRVLHFEAPNIKYP